MGLKAVFRMVGVARASVFISKPVAVGSPSDQPSAGLWQLAQLMFALRDKRGSKNSIWPSSTRAAVGRLSAGAGAFSGRSQGSALTVEPTLVPRTAGAAITVAAQRNTNGSTNVSG